MTGSSEKNFLLPWSIITWLLQSSGSWLEEAVERAYGFIFLYQDGTPQNGTLPILSGALSPGNVLWVGTGLGRGRWWGCSRWQRRYGDPAGHFKDSQPTTPTPHPLPPLLASPSIPPSEIPKPLVPKFPRSWLRCLLPVPHWSHTAYTHFSLTQALGFNISWPAFVLLKPDSHLLRDCQSLTEISHLLLSSFPLSCVSWLCVCFIHSLFFFF